MTKINRLRIAGQLHKLLEAAKSVLSPCDDSEKRRGYCCGHGGLRRLPCEFAELRAVVERIEKKK